MLPLSLHQQNRMRKEEPVCNPKKTGVLDQSTNHLRSSAFMILSKKAAGFRQPSLWKQSQTARMWPHSDRHLTCEVSTEILNSKLFLARISMANTGLSPAASHLFKKKPGFCEYRLDHGGGWEALICATAQIWNKYHGQDVVKWNCVLTENHCRVFCNGLQHLISRRIKFKLMDVHLKGRQFKQHWVVAGVSHAPTNLHTASVHKEVLVSTTKKGILTTGHRVCKDFFHLNNQRQGKERTLIWDDHTQDDELHMRFLSMCGYNALPWSCDSRTMIQIQFVSHYFRIFCPSWNAVFMSILWTCWVSYC